MNPACKQWQRPDILAQMLQCFSLKEEQHALTGSGVVGSLDPTGQTAGSSTHLPDYFEVQMFFLEMQNIQPAVLVK